MKRFLFFLLAAAMLLTGCQSAPEETAPETAPETTSETTEAVDISAYLCHWENIPLGDGKLHYYFMSANGMIIDPENTYPDKWGDCCLIVFPDGQTMLVDSGNRPFAPVLVENLRKMGIKMLDYVILTHLHRDHVSGVIAEDGVIHALPIGKVLTSGVANGAYEDPQAIEKACAAANVPLEILKMGDSLTVGEVKLQVLWPEPALSGTTISGTEEINNASLVFRLDYKDHSALFAGDLYTSAEAQLLNKEGYRELLQADLLKAPHHGGKTSNSMDFVGAVSPQVAVATGYTPIVSGVRTAYELTSTVLLTDKSCGCIHITTDGTAMEAECQRSGSLPLS